MLDQDRREIEILVQLHSDFQTAKTALEKYEFKGIKETVDDYYYDPLRPNLQPNTISQLPECFRLREKAGQYSMAYKVNHFDGDTWLYSDEYETGLMDLQAAQAIISRLGLELLVRVENAKHTYVTDIYEIVLENVKDLGYFLEIEFTGSIGDRTVASVKDQIQQFINSLGLKVGEASNDGKPELLLQKKLNQG